MYSVFRPINHYDQVLDVLSMTHINSVKTSSIPLADFWHPERNLKQKERVIKKLGISDNNEYTQYCFEYPTRAYKNRKNGQKLKYSQSSMTDLMIITSKTRRVTIEAKYTEYVKDKEYNPKLADWYDNSTHRKDIIQCWLDYIYQSGKCEINDAECLIQECAKLPYQFLHRTASACFDCENPMLVYQLFYDNESYSDMKEFEVLLKSAAQMLTLKSDKLPFYIIEVKVSKHPKSAENIFEIMKTQTQYIFSDEINILDGYTLLNI